MTWLGTGIPIQQPSQQGLPGGVGSGGTGGGGVNSAPVIPNVTLRFDIVASGET